MGPETLFILCVLELGIGMILYFRWSDRVLADYFAPASSGPSASSDQGGTAADTTSTARTRDAVWSAETRDQIWGNPYLVQMAATTAALKEHPEYRDWVVDYLRRQVLDQYIYDTAWAEVQKAVREEMRYRGDGPG